MRYAIAERFSEEVRRAALKETYEATGHGPRRARAGEFCPLGVMILAKSNADVIVGAPTCCDVQAFLEHGELADQRRAGRCPDECDAAAKFINDWDDGKISDLAEALGVQS